MGHLIRLLSKKKCLPFQTVAQAVFVGLITVWATSVLTSQEQKNGAASPPSLEKIIQKVQSRTRPLDTAVVQLTPFSGADDGGGRLYWKRGKFVRSKAYRIGSRGTVEVYDTVSNQKDTSFLFHTIKTSGPSFSFCLRMPYESASDTGYGISDYFLLEHVADRRFDVKYGNRLMSLQLFPQQLRTFGDRYEIAYVQKENQRYIRLRRKNTMIKTFYFTESIYLNPSTWQFEQLVYEDNRRWHRIQATSYQEVSGVRLPERVRVISPQFNRPLPYELEYSVRHDDQLEAVPTPPDWLEDPGVPQVSRLSTREVHEQLKKEVTADLYKSLMQAGIRYRHMLFPSHFHPKKFQTSVDLARRKHPASPLLKAYKDGVASAIEVSEDQMYITTFPSMKTDVVLPYMNYAAAYRSLVAGYHDKMKAYLKPIRDTYPYGRIAKRLDTLSTLRTMGSVEEFRTLLKTLTNRAPVHRQNGIIPELARKLQENSEWVKEVKALLKQEPDPFLHLLLARFYQGKDQFVKSNDHLLQIAERRSLQSDLISYVRRAGFRAETLIEALQEDITFVSILIRLSLKRYQQGKPEQAIRISERIRSILKNGESHVLGSMKTGDQTVEQSMSILVSLFNRLHGSNRDDLVLDLLHYLMKLYRLPWDQDELLDLFNEMYEGKTHRLYQIAFNYVLVGRTDLVAEFLSPDQFREHLLELIREESVADWEYIALSRAITSGFIRTDEFLRKSLSNLKGAKKRFSETNRNGPFILNGLGDAHFQLDDDERAAKYYQRLLKRIRRTTHPKFFPNMFRSIEGGRVASLYRGDEPTIETTDPVIVKLASVLSQTRTSGSDPKQEIWPYVRLYSTGTSPAMAFLLLGEKDVALRHLLFRFRQAKKKRVGKRLMNVLVEIFKHEERFAEAALIFDMAIREKKVENQEIKDRYQHMKDRISQEQLIDELRKQDYGTPPRRAMRAVDHVLRQMKQAKNQKETMKYVSKLLNSQANVVPVLLKRVDSSSGRVQRLVKKILETVRMRQIYRKLFDMQKGRTFRDASTSGN